MRKSLSQRRVPRKIGQDDDDEGVGSEGATGSQIKRPSSKVKKASGLRAAYGPADEDDGEEAASVVAPKKSNISRLAIQRNASKRSSYLASDLPQADTESDAPSYSASDLQALKDSTPSTPQHDVDDVSNSTQALDLSSKFGSSLARYNQPSAIPSATEIAEKKARRARLAKENEAEEFLSLDPDTISDNESLDDNVTKDASGRLILKPKDKYKQSESRLVRDDEDIMEGFDEFTGDTGNRINMGESTRNDAQKRRKEEMAAQIQAAEGSASNSSDDSDNERNNAFELAQTRHGHFSTSTVTAPQDPADARPKTPPKISPLPNIDSVLSRLKAQLADMQTARSRSLGEMEALKREKVRIGEEEVRIQKALKGTAEKFEALRAEKGIEGTSGSANANGIGTKEGTPALLEGAGTGLGFAGAKEEGGGDDVVDDDDWGDEGDEKPALGLGMGGRGLESLGLSSKGMPLGADGQDGMSE